MAGDLTELRGEGWKRLLAAARRDLACVIADGAEVISDFRVMAGQASSPRSRSISSPSGKRPSPPRPYCRITPTARKPTLA